VSTIRVTNGTLTDDGGGQVTISTSNTTPGGSDTYVQFNDSTSLGGDSGFTYNKTTNTATLERLNFSGILGNYVSKTANYTALTTDYFIACDASGGSFTITLLAASGNTGMRLLIKKTDSSGNTVTIDGNASETIDGSTTQVINTQYECYELICSGSNWYIS
jgi:hypothetical protein